MSSHSLGSAKSPQGATGGAQGDQKRSSGGQGGRGGGEAPISDAQKKRLFAIGFGAGLDNRGIYQVVFEVTGDEHVSELQRDQYDAVCERLEKGKRDVGNELPDPTPADLEPEHGQNARVDTEDDLPF